MKKKFLSGTILEKKISKFQFKKWILDIDDQGLSYNYIWQKKLKIMQFNLRLPKIYYLSKNATLGLSLHLLVVVLGLR